MMDTVGVNSSDSLTTLAGNSSFGFPLFPLYFYGSISACASHFFYLFCLSFDMASTRRNRLCEMLNKIFTQITTAS